MPDLPRAVMKMTSSIPEERHSSTMTWMAGTSTIGRSYLGTDFVTGSRRVPNTATGMTALRNGLFISNVLFE